METAFWFSMTIAACLVLSFALAAIGEPQAIWLWRDVLGVM